MHRGTNDYSGIAVQRCAIGLRGQLEEKKSDAKAYQVGTCRRHCWRIMCSGGCRNGGIEGSIEDDRIVCRA
ncbi:hypothetical protein PSAC2689_140029 [Paraburkholderia sacchari]